MATKVRIEYGDINRPDTASPGLMTSIPTDVDTLTVGVTATAGEDRPIVPDGVNYAFVIAVDGNVIVAAGDDPTADQISGKLCLQGVETPIPVEGGQLLSFIELA